MAKITFKGNEVNTNGSLPAVGAEAPDFKGVKSDLSELHLKDLKGKKVVINVFPSLDTAVCAASVRRLIKKPLLFLILWCLPYQKTCLLRKDVSVPRKVSIK